MKINHYSWAIGYSTLEARAYDADLIVSGIVKNKLSPLIKNDGETEEAFHQSEVAIENVIKGEGSKGDTIILPKLAEQRIRLLFTMRILPNSKKVQKY